MGQLQSVECKLRRECEDIREFYYIFPGKTASILKSNTLIAYSVHGILLNMSDGGKEWFIENEHPLVMFLKALCAQ